MDKKETLKFLRKVTGWWWFQDQKYNVVTLLFTNFPTLTKMNTFMVFTLRNRYHSLFNIANGTSISIKLKLWQKSFKWLFLKRTNKWENNTKVWYFNDFL